MAHISRPFQIALVGFVLLAGVWLFALQGHSTSSSSSGSASSAPPAAAPKASAAAEEKAAAARTPTYHGSAPGVAGLTGAIAKAHGAVATSQQNARQLESKSAAASSSSAVHAGTTSTTSAGTVSHSVTSTHVTVTKTTTTSVTRAKAPSRPVSHANVRQHAVEAELAAGKVVVVLFWNPRGADDRADVVAARAVISRHTAVQFATTGEVAAFGSITRGVQVFGTPTTLIVGKSGKTNVITGLTDPYSLQQAVNEARSA